MKTPCAAMALALMFASHARGEEPDRIDVCKGGNRAARHITCIYDGDTGWENGVKWRLLDVDAPEIADATCSKELDLAHRSRDRLIALMRDGYSIRWSGKGDGRGKRARQLVDVVLSDGRNVAAILIHEGLAQPWPNRGNVWCE